MPRRFTAPEAIPNYVGAALETISRQRQQATENDLAAQQEQRAQAGEQRQQAEFSAAQAAAKLKSEQLAQEQDAARIKDAMGSIVQATDGVTDPAERAARFEQLAASPEWKARIGPKADALIEHVRQAGPAAWTDSALETLAAQAGVKTLAQRRREAEANAAGQVLVRGTPMAPRPVSATAGAPRGTGAAPKPAAAPTLSPDAITLMAQRLVQGDDPRRVLANLGRGAQGSANISAVQNEVARIAAEQGLDASVLLRNTQLMAGHNAAIGAAGRREGGIASRIHSVIGAANQALNMSARVSRGRFMPWTRLSQFTDAQLNDPQLASLKAATNTLLNEYSAAVSGGVMHQGDRQHAESMLNTAQSPEAYRAVVAQLQLEAKIALDAARTAQQELAVPAGQRPAAGRPSLDSFMKGR